MPVVGDERIVKRFALLPRTVMLSKDERTETRVWLESYLVKQRFCLAVFDPPFWKTVKVGPFDGKMELG